MSDAQALVKLLTDINQQVIERLCARLEQVEKANQELHRQLTNLLDAYHQENIAKIGALKAQISDFTKSASGQKRAPKTTGTGDAATPAEGTATPTENAAPAAVADEKFDGNKMIHFRRKYREDPVYREWILSELEKLPSFKDIRQTISNDDAVIKKPASEKLRAEAGVLWPKFKEVEKETKTLMDMIEAKFKQEKNEHEMRNKAPDQTVEAVTPK